MSFYSNYITNINKCKPDYHINMIYCGGSCISHYREFIRTLKGFMSEFIKNRMIVSSSDWPDYHDVITYRASKYYCMISNGCCISIPKPYNADKEYGDECAICKITNDNEP